MQNNLSATATPRHFLRMFGSLQLPAAYRNQAQRLSVPHQIAIALMLNVLSLAMPIMMLQIYDRIIPHQSYGTLVMLIAGVLGALAFDAALRVIRAWLVGWSAASHEHNASCAALDQMARSNVISFEKISAGEHLQNMTALGRLREFYSGQALTALVDLPFASLFLILIAYLGGWLALVPVTLLALFCLGAQLAGVRLRKRLESRSTADDRKASLVVSVLTGIHTTKAMAMEAPMMRRFEAAQSDVSDDSYRVALASGAANNLSAAFGQLSLILTASAGCLLVIHGQLSVGGLSACTLLAGRAIQPVQRVLGTWLRLQDLAVARKQAEALFSMPVQARETAAPVFAPEGRVVIENVSYAYDADAVPLLRDINLMIEPGEVVGIGGSKGSGKSTLLQIIAGALTPTAGLVRVDEVDPAAYSLAALSTRIGYLPQQGTIFRGTILENITGFRDGDDVVVRARHAAAALGLDAIIDLLPRGYSTLLTDTASDPVPPGVKQRIALTRVLMNDPALLLFDDADRALDKEGYNQLFRMIGRLKGRVTLIIVSQDQNLQSFADRYYNLGRGELRSGEIMGNSNLSHLSLSKGSI